MRFGLLIALVVSSCYHLPKWEGDVVVHPRTREAIGTCGTGALTAEGRRRISRAPYLQSTTTRSTVVVWGSTDGTAEVLLRDPDGTIVTTSRAEYAGDPARATARLEAQRTRGDRLRPDDIYLVKAELANLEPTRLYCYQLVAGGVALTEPAPLTTAAAPELETTIKFVAVGDTGTGGDAARAIKKRMTEVEFDLILFLGDIAYTSGTAAQLETRFFQLYEDILRYVPAYPVIGNHERRTRRGGPYFEAFVLPGNERYYSFDWGDVHFVAIDTTQVDSAQLQWLREDLRRNKLPWVIAFGHHPPYTSSYRGAKRAVRRAFAKIFADHKVDLVLTGHEHHYERFRVGTVNYVVSGGGGGQLNHFWGNTNALEQATVHHFLAFEVSAKTLVMKVQDISGQRVETLRLTKDAERVIPKPDGTIHDAPDGDPPKQPDPDEQVPVTQR